MGGIPAMLSGAAGAVGSGLSHGASALYGAAKDGLKSNYIDPIKRGIDTMRGNPGSHMGYRDAEGAPTAIKGMSGMVSPAASSSPGEPSAMQENLDKFFNSSPQSETPAMRLRRMQQEQA